MQRRLTNLPLTLARALFGRADASCERTLSVVYRLNREPHTPEEYAEAAARMERAHAHRSALRSLLSYHPRFRVHWNDGNNQGTLVTAREAS